jgi:ribonuclease VapC
MCGPFVETAAIRVVPVTDSDAETALDAFARYGKGQGHPAQLNLGDCFAYAVARNHRAAMLFKGGDFARTDLSLAQPRTE